jgi:tetratricopeptide (TPR) repeat protein
MAFLKFSLLILLAIPVAVSAEITLRPTDAQLMTISRAISFIFQDSFALSYELIPELNDTLPGKPLEKLLYASILFSEMSDAEDYSREKELLKNIDDSIDSFKKLSERHPRDPWGQFLLGSAYGYKSVYFGQTGGWFKSLLAGLKAKSRFSDAIKLDPRLFDAYTGLGSYHYWSSAKLKKYIPFLSDNRKKGLEELRLAADSSEFSRGPAIVGLAWALINENKLGDALKISKEFYSTTHGGRASLWLLGGIYWRRGDYNRTIQYYDELLESLKRAGNQNCYNLIFCNYRKGTGLYSQKKYPEARKEFESILSYDLSPEIKKRHEETIKKTKDYLKKMEGK